MIQPSELTGSPLPKNDLTINELWLRNVHKYESALALICTHQASDLYGISNSSIKKGEDKDAYLRWTHGDVERAIKIFSNSLRREGFEEGDIIFTFAGNSAESVISTWAAFRIGLIHVPINPKNLSYDREIRHMLNTSISASGSSPRKIAIIAGTGDLCSSIEELTAGLNCIKILVDFKGSGTGWISFEDLMQMPNEDCQDDHHIINTLKPQERSLFFTSGTTSLPKGCFLEPSASPLAVAIGWQQGDQAMSPGEKFALALPNNHAFGHQCLMACLLNAITVVFSGSGFNPERMTETIHKEQCQYTALVPTMVLALSLSQRMPEKKLTSLRRVILAGAPPSEETVRICLEDLGASGVQNQYGMTEGTLASTNIARNVSDLIVPGHILLGKPFPGAKIRICAQGSKLPVPAGTAGQMHFCGPSLIAGYLSLPDDDQFYIGDNGETWFRTGDKAFMGDDGQLYLVGRFKETIIRAGENIEPSAIEAVLCQDLEFYALEPQVVRSPDEIAGEVPVVVINCEVDANTAYQLKATIRERMGPLYVPTEVIPLQSLGLKSFPRTMSGKIQKKRLEELVFKQRLHVSNSQNLDHDRRTNEGSLGSQIVASLLSAIEQHKGMAIDDTTRIMDLGVDSITSITINHQVQKETGVSLPSSLFFTQMRVGTLSDHLSTISDPMELLNFSVPMTEEPPELCFSALLQGTPKPGCPALFLLPPGSGYAFSYNSLPKFSNDIAVYSLGSPFFMTKSESTWSVEEAAAIYARTILSLQAHGPYILGGWSMGAILAYEVAFQLSQQGKDILGVINLDMGASRPLTTKIPEPCVELFKIMGFYPPIHHEGQPDMEIPGYRKRHSVSSFCAKMRYSPRPMSSLVNAKPVRIFVIWAAHGDHDRLPNVIFEADEILKKYGPHTQLRTDQGWLRLPRETFDSGGWEELVGAKNVDFETADGAFHDTILEPGIVESVAAQMELVVNKWLSQPFP
ncbi:acetyl-CoA synthetase-like protein [Penicillium manginii]|uniref:acetyl-CoA synthetase-like protein n=1 Tax=Penicillium manginii TaxID=203109 RepID=UPI0025469E8A|nr:acetyl-CoA synthetase-like protein [Penicillium manginii]KAJ5762891.1 acetyl-CoA synthetase-like protein [Penicillium manginii]